MDPQRWEQIKSIFDTIVGLEDMQRISRLKALSASDPELCAAVELLLAADSDADARLASLDSVFFPQSAPALDLLGLAGQTISHFEVREAIGAGGMGVVYRADDTRLGRPVALKFLLPSHSLDASAKARFLREAHLVAALDHPNLCSIHEVGTTRDGRFFLAMALYPGETLKTRMIRDGAMSVSEALEITRQIIEGLRCAHDAGIVHRDLKPGNIMLVPDGTVKILDFGVAKARDQSLSEPGARFGTVSYMSPEQIRGETVNERADLWAVGVVLYEMLTKRKPFTGEQDISIAHAIVHDEPAPLATLRGDLSAPLEDLVLRLLQKDPSARFATAKELLDELTRVGIPNGGAVLPARGRLRRAWGSVPRRVRTRRWVPVMIGGAVSVAAIGGALAAPRKTAPEPPDRVQLTFTGNAIAPSLSHDGRHVAFGEKQCDRAGYCTYQLVTQNTDGSGRVVLVRNIGYIYHTQWLANDRLLEFSGSYPPLRHGAFAVSPLGGIPTYLGCCTFHWVSGDTALLRIGGIPAGGTAWVRRITVHDGRTIDSIPIRDQGATHHINGLTIPDRLLVAVRKTFESAPELRLTDFRGQVIDRVTPPFWSRDVLYPSRWLSSRGQLVVASRLSVDPAWQRELAGTEFDILAMKVTPSHIDPHIDTVFAGVQLGNGLFDVSPDGERLVYSTGPVETSLSVIDAARGTTGRLPATQLLSSTTLLRGRISPAGDMILLVRDAPQGGAHSSQLSLIPRGGGPESQIQGAVENLLDFDWSPDRARIMYLQGIEGNKIRLMETETTGRGTREIVRLPRSAAVQFHPLRDGSAALIPAERRSISMILRAGQRDVTWRVPEWIRVIGSISRSPDAKSLVIEGMNRSGDSVVVATVDIASGVFIRVGSLMGSDPQRVAWLDDGSIMLVLREKQGAAALYRIVKDRAPERLGVLPNMQADFSISGDGKYVAEFAYSDKKDVYMIRNFGKMLRR